MITFIKTSNPFTALVLFIYTILTRLNIIWYFPEKTIENTPPHFLEEFAQFIFPQQVLESRFLLILVSVLSVYGQAILIQVMAHRSKLFFRSGYLVAFVYLSLTALDPSFTLFSVPTFSMWLWIIGFYFLASLYQFERAGRQIFNIAFLWSTLALIIFPAQLLMLVLIFGLLAFRRFNSKEWVIALLGWFVPIYFFLSILFLSDQWRFTNELIQWSNNFSQFGAIQWPTVVTLSCAALICSLALINLSNSFNGLTAHVRRVWNLVIFSTLLLIVVCGLASLPSTGVWVLTLLPLSLLLSLSFQNYRFRWVNQAVFYLFIAMIIFKQVSF